MLAIALALMLSLCIVACDKNDDVAGNTPDVGNTDIGNTEDGNTDGDNEDNGNTVNQTGVWENAKYLKDTTIGEGDKTLTVVVKAEDQSITFTVKTDKTTVGAALIEHTIIEGENSQFGLYIKKVNGILADYDVDRTYWAFYANGEYSATGVDTTEIVEGVTYSLERTK